MMRPFGYIMMMAAAATLTFGCQQLEEMRLLPPEQVVPPVLNPLGITELVITDDNLDETVSFAWDAADFGVMILCQVQKGRGSSFHRVLPARPTRLPMRT